MNFLAHLHLGRHTEEFLLGSLLGDFIRGRITDDLFTEEIREGIRLHRAIDAFTDRQEAWQRSRARLSPPRRRFAGIIVDLYYDHFLSRHWDRFSPEQPREAFIAHSYRSILENVRLVRGAAERETRAILRRVAREDWLGRYHDVEGISETIDRVSRRSPRIAAIRGSGEELRAGYAEFEGDFLAFYPRILAYSRNLTDA